MSRRPLPGYVKLLLCMFTIWLLLWVITPLWVPYSKLHQDFAACLLYTFRAHETRHDLVCRLLLEIGAILPLKSY